VLYPRFPMGEGWTTRSGAHLDASTTRIASSSAQARSTVDLTAL
jgi:hypothetical protein